MDNKAKGTPLKVIYDAFLNLITDDMYLEWDERETYEDIENLFLSAISKFEFPKFSPYDFIKEGELVGKEEVKNSDGGIDLVSIYADESYYSNKLTMEEINILSHLMILEWLNRQLASIEVIRQNYSSRDFEFTSQANHLDKLIKLKEDFRKENIKLQRLYGRRKLVDGKYIPNYQGFGGKNNAN